MPTDSDAILVVGGAGFIGSHMVLALRKAGHSVVVLDNLSKGHRDAVRDATFIVGEMSDRALLDQLFETYSFKAVMHFASYIEVAESVREPIRYYQNNVAATLTLLEMMLQHHVMHFIFSSSASVYGEPQHTPIPETHPLSPLHPYGRSKKMIEEMVQDLSHSHGLRYAILRYFNAAGAAYQQGLGERHEPESHLIPLILQVAQGVHPHVTIYGDDYATYDGTCVRDYVHVLDLCDAHLLALQALQAGEPNLIANLGRGEGVSVQSVIEMARAVTKHVIPAKIAPRRSGDPAILVADITFAREVLRWKPVYSDLETIIQHAWRWVSSSSRIATVP